MSDYLIDTNVVVDFATADILHFLNIHCFFVSQLVYEEEISKQISFPIRQSQIIKETGEDILFAYKLHEEKKKISVYDAINISLAKRYKFALLTGDQILMKQAKSEGVDCHGTIWIIKRLIENHGADKNKMILALKKLLDNGKRRVPSSLINSLIKELE
ncbi:MAG: hypothetical protein MJ238_06300 [Bacilli bacterium]|nr:hypothetical protein [Bacilli bacterium]